MIVSLARFSVVAGLAFGPVPASTAPVQFHSLAPPNPSDNGHGVRTIPEDNGGLIGSTDAPAIGEAVALTRLPQCSDEEIVLMGPTPEGVTPCNVVAGQILVLVGPCVDSGVTIVAHNGRTYCWDVDF